LDDDTFKSGRSPPWSRIHLMALAFPLHSVWVYVVTAIIMLVNHRRLQRQLPSKFMPASAESWLAQSPRRRLQVNWAVARGTSVHEADLAPLAVARARMRQAQYAHFHGRRVVVLYAFYASTGAFLVWLGAAQNNGWWFLLGALVLVSGIPDAISRRSRPARLQRAEESNLHLCSPSPGSIR
jgi:hypothetical protein